MTVHVVVTAAVSVIGIVRTTVTLIAKAMAMAMAMALGIVVIILVFSSMSPPSPSAGHHPRNLLEPDRLAPALASSGTSIHQWYFACLFFVAISNRHHRLMCLCVAVLAQV